MRTSWAAGATIAVLVACGYLFFPGHTYLHSDTQIYIPILEHMRDPSVFTKDIVALRPHVSFTIYDEMARGLRAVIGAADFRTVLHAQQLVFRFCGLMGVFLVGQALGFPWRMALLLASVYGLGATIIGPSVLIHEYEPVPRGFAGGLSMLAVGLMARERWMWGGVALGVAILYHPPTTYPLMIVLSAYAAWKREVRWVAPVAVGVVASLLLSRLQAGATEPQQFWGVIDAELEKLQRMRGSYNWISMWNASAIRHHQFAALVCLAALWRLRPPMPIRWIWAGLPVVGVVAMPASYLLLDAAKWQFLPQFQPLRAVLFITLVAALASAACGIRAGRGGRFWEALAWFCIAFAIPAQADALQLLLPDWRDEAIRARALVVVALAALAAVAARWNSSPAWVAALLLPFYLYPGPGQVRNYRNQDEPEIRQLAQWARNSTARDAVFLFPDAEARLHPGFFRAYSLRNLYVDFKGGGQVNLLREFAFEWWERWQKSIEKGKDLGYYGGLGIDYVVFRKASKPQFGHAVWQGKDYVAFATRE